MRAPGKAWERGGRYTDPSEPYGKRAAELVQETLNWLENQGFDFSALSTNNRRPSPPDQGLLVWHLDENGSNSNQEMTAELHYYASVEQADGQFHLENNRSSGGEGDPMERPWSGRSQTGARPGARPLTDPEYLSVERRGLTDCVCDLERGRSQTPGAAAHRP